MSHARPRPAATAQAESVTAAIRAEAAHIAASWGPAGSFGSTNCGRKAVKNTIVFGFDKRHDEAANKSPATAVLEFPPAPPGVPPGLNAEPDEIGRAGPPQRLEQQTCVRHDPVEADGDGGEQQNVARRRPRHRRQRGAHALGRAGRNNEGDDRAPARR